MECFHCGSKDIRFSRPRSEDSRELLRLNVPVRCCSCNDRFHINVFRAWRMGILGKAPQGRRIREGNTSRGRRKSDRTEGQLALNREGRSGRASSL